MDSPRDPGETAFLLFMVIERQLDRADLAWMHLQASVAGASTTPDAFEALAKETKLEAPALRLLASRVFHDEQVRRIWILYNTFVESGTSPNSGGGSTPPSSKSTEAGV